MNKFIVTDNVQENSKRLYENTGEGELFRGILRGETSKLDNGNYNPRDIADLQLWRITYNQASDFDIDSEIDKQNINNPVYRTTDLPNGLYFEEDVVDHIAGSGSKSFYLKSKQAASHIKNVVYPAIQKRRKVTGPQEEALRYTSDWQEICRVISDKTNVEELRKISETLRLPTTDENGKKLGKPALCAQLAIHMEESLLGKEECINPDNFSGDSFSNLPSPCIVRDGGYCFDVMEIKDQLPFTDKNQTKKQNPFTRANFTKETMKYVDEHYDSCKLARETGGDTDVHELKLRRKQNVVINIKTQELRDILSKLPDFKYTGDFLAMDNKEIGKLIRAINISPVGVRTKFKVIYKNTPTQNLLGLVESLRDLDLDGQRSRALGSGGSLDDTQVGYVMTTGYEQLYPPDSDAMVVRNIGVTDSRSNIEDIPLVPFIDPRTQYIIYQIAEPGDFLYQKNPDGSEVRIGELLIDTELPSERYSSPEEFYNRTGLWLVHDNVATDLPYRLNRIQITKNLHNGVYKPVDFCEIHQILIYYLKTYNGDVVKWMYDAPYNNYVQYIRFPIQTGIHEEEEIIATDPWLVTNNKLAYPLGSYFALGGFSQNLNWKEMIGVQTNLEKGVYGYDKVAENLISPLDKIPSHTNDRADYFVIQKNGKKLLVSVSEDKIISPSDKAGEILEVKSYTYEELSRLNLWSVTEYDDNNQAVLFASHNDSRTFSTTLGKGIYSYQEIVDNPVIDSEPVDVGNEDKYRIIKINEGEYMLEYLPSEGANTAYLLEDGPYVEGTYDKSDIEDLSLYYVERDEQVVNVDRALNLESFDSLVRNNSPYNTATPFPFREGDEQYLVQGLQPKRLYRRSTINTHHVA